MWQEFCIHFFPYCHRDKCPFLVRCLTERSTLVKMKVIRSLTNVGSLCRITNCDNCTLKDNRVLSLLWYNLFSLRMQWWKNILAQNILLLLYYDFSVDICPKSTLRRRWPESHLPSTRRCRSFKKSDIKFTFCLAKALIFTGTR